MLISFLKKIRKEIEWCSPLRKYFFHDIDILTFTKVERYIISVRPLWAGY